MSHRRRTLSALVAAAATGAVIAVALLTPTAEAAAPTWTVKAGSAPAGTTVGFVGTTTGASPQVTLVDVTSGTTLNCAKDILPGNLVVGTGLAAAGLLRFPGATTPNAGCNGPLGAVFTATGNGVATFAPTSISAGVVTGTVSGIDITLNDNGGNCSVRATGTLVATYTNADHTLHFTVAKSRITLSRVVGCFGLINEGDQAGVTADHVLAPRNAAYGPIAITQG